MNINIEVKREEAVKRLEILKGLGMSYTAPLRAFKEGEDVGIFENMGPGAEAVYYALNLNTGDGGFYDDLKAAVDEFEKEHNAIVYLILVTHTAYGTLCDMLYVSDYKKEWPSDRADLQEGLSCVYCYNLEEPMFSEFGTVAFEFSKRYGGIYRV